MEQDRMYRLLFEEFLRITNDGFIVVDPQGIVIEINQQYCDFFGKPREEIVGFPIEKTISTTSMYDVLKRRLRGDGHDGVYIHPYSHTDTQKRVDTYGVGNRFCFFDADGALLGAAAQVTFKENTAAMATSLAEEELRYYKDEYLNRSGSQGSFDRILGNDPKLVQLKKRAAKVAGLDFPVLITGETGTGKELFAKALHMESPRRDKPIVSINCAAIPAELLESELFGYAEGAFTGAKRGGKVGKFQLADQGTLFLDEIGDMSLPLQVKLLRVLQEQEVEPVGGEGPIPINVRIVAATRQDLPKMIREGAFREDLYYRLNVINLETIPLRDRPGDILLHANHTLDKLNQEYKTSIMLSDAAKGRLMGYTWPGNVRELTNVIASAYTSCDMLMIDEVDLPARLLSRAADPNKRLASLMADYEAAIIRDTLRQYGQSCTAAAAALGIDRSLLYRKMKKAGITVKKVLS